jgi:serine/threonine protein kinase
MPEAEPTSSEQSELRYGSYRVLHPLGSGGMSSVYRAVHVDAGHEVALKVLPARMAKNPIVLQRFLREARSAESLEHPNIVSIYDRGVDQGRHYLVLEYVQGSDLHEYVQMRGPLSAAEGIRVIRQVAEGLQFASTRGLIHRDIKPSNILRGKGGEIKITDLGLALQAEFEDERVTREGTTVGTVDYMAPEQARDSRAASLQSDLYSLGCTFYYLLTGIPPYPGGDITDKLTRHAKSAPPDVRDLRPDVPEALSQVMLRMMAKRPEDRFASFDALIEALDKVPVRDDAESPGAALAPLDPPDSLAAEVQPARLGVRVILDGRPSRPPSSIPEISLASLPPEPVEDEPPSTYVRVGGREPAAGVLSRLGGTQSLASRAGRPEAIPVRDSRPSALSVSAWITLCVAIGASFVFMVIVIDRFVRSSPANSTSPSFASDQPASDTSEPAIGMTDQAPRTIPPPVPPRKDRASSSPPPDAKPADRLGAVAVEPEDVDPPGPVAARYTEETLRKYLPEWALAPVPSRVEGPLFQVRRVAGARDPTLVPTLRMALNETKGTIEIADEGPFSINDFRVPGETRLIRARAGFRPIIRIDRPNLEAVSSLPGVIVLEGKSLVLDSLDMIVNLRDLTSSQGSLFHCTGANLTVRNCTITLINPANQPFTLVRAEGSATRASRIRIEKTLIRGAVSSGFDFGKGAADVAIQETIFLGSQGPLVRVLDPERRADQRFSVVGGVLACRGPGFDLKEAAGGDAKRKVGPLVIRAFDTVFGRFQGAGIASVLCSESPLASPRDRVDWLGQQNLFCGWKGYYASGADHTLRVPNLSGFRSTWNGTDQNSREILASWPQPQHLGQVVPADLGPFITGREAALVQAAAPRPFLGAKTIWSFPPPAVPALLVLAGRGEAGAAAADPQRKILDNKPVFDSSIAAVSDTAPANRALPELVFDADSVQWHGDLGAFLRDTMTDAVKHARVRVKGSGPLRSSPVRLHDGLVLELRVEAPPNRESEWLSWAPEAEARGRALIELHGGTLLLSQLRLRADESAAIESLILVEDGDLILHRCQFAAPPGTEAHTPRLVSFTAAGTRPRPPAPQSGVFTIEPDRPVCMILESTLITGGSAVRTTLGKGLVVLIQTALAAGTDAIEMVPARVARGRFEADLVLDHCTLASEANIIRLGSWPGRDPGPDRPWLITSRSCAFLGSYDRRVSETVLLRVDEMAMAHGTVFWQGGGDAIEVDAFTAAGAEPLPGRTRDVGYQWVNFWGSNHQQEITGPRSGSNLPSVRLWERLRPGRVEPSDLILDPVYHPGRPRLDVGADLARQGIARRSPAGGRRR